MSNCGPYESIAKCAVNATEAAAVSKILYDSTDKTAVDVVIAAKRTAAAERMCPFIYDELPAFILERKTPDILFKVAMPPPPPPPQLLPSPPQTRCYECNALQFESCCYANENNFQPQLPKPLSLSPPSPLKQPQLPRSRPPKLNKALLNAYSNSYSSITKNNTSKTRNSALVYF